MPRAVVGAVCGVFAAPDYAPGDGVHEDAADGCFGCVEGEGCLGLLGVVEGRGGWRYHGEGFAHEGEVGFSLFWGHGSGHLYG